MKRIKLVKHLRKHGCTFVREGGSHSWWMNLQADGRSSVPRHNEIDDQLAKKICKDLHIPPVK